MSKIIVSNLYKSFGKNHILKGIDLTIESEQAVVILGKSGAGKSILIKSIIGLINSDQGSVLINNIDIQDASTKKKFDLMKYCGYLFQDGALFDSLTIEQNILFFAQRLFKLNFIGKRKLVKKLIDKVQLPSRVLELFPSELSGGMKKRASLARAISTNPQILFFDEPTTGLDPKTSQTITQLIIDLQKELRATTITITHDIASGYAIADIVCLLHEGKIVWQGQKDGLLDSSNMYIKNFITPYLSQINPLTTNLVI